MEPDFTRIAAEAGAMGHRPGQAVAQARATVLRPVGMGRHAWWVRRVGSPPE